MTVSTPTLLAMLRTGPSAPVTLETNRHAFVDTARGISIILVVMMHATLGVGELMDGEGWLHPLVAFAQPFRMPAFFLVVGLLLASSIDRPWRRYLDGKVLHFIYFYLLWAGIHTLLRSSGSLSRFLETYAESLIHPFGTLWFIYLLPCLLLAARLARPVPIPIIAFGAFGLHMAQPATGLFVIDAFSQWCVFVVVGLWLAPSLLRLAEAAAAQPAMAIAFIATVFVGNAMVLAGSDAAHPHGYGPLPGLAGALAIIVASALLARMRLAQALSEIGRRSLTIYLAFSIPMVATRIALERSGLIADIGTMSVIVTVAAVGVPLAMAIVAARTPLRFLFERPRWLTLRSAASSA